MDKSCCYLYNATKGVIPFVGLQAPIIIEHSANLNRAHFNFEQSLGFFESLNAVRDAERARLALGVDSKAPV